MPSPWRFHAFSLPYGSGAAKSRAGPDFHPGFRLIHPALLPFPHNRTTLASVVESECAHAEIKHMSKCLSVSVPLGPGKPPGLLVPARGHVGSPLRRTAREAARLSQAQERTGRGGAGESVPLMGTLPRVLGIAVRSLRLLSRPSGRVQFLLERLGSPLQRGADASDLGRSPITAEPVRNPLHKTFRGTWTHTKSGARFERKRLMRMTHQAGC